MEKTTQEKIDYIYNHIKTERKFIYAKRIYKGCFYIFMIGYMYYFYMYGFSQLKNSIMNTLTPNISVESVVKNLQGKTGGLQGKGSDALNKVKEMIKKEREKSNNNNKVEGGEEY